MIKAPTLACLTAVAGGFLASLANAQSMEAARAALDEGRFVEAAEIAEALGTSNGHALAAQSLAIHGHHFANDDDKKPMLKRAMELAEEAVRMDPENPEAHLHSAHALGRYAQTVGKIEAFRKEFPARLRDSLEEAIRLKPDMAAAHFSLGVWHVQARRLGGVMAGLFYGANYTDGFAHFERAVEIAPDDIPTLYWHAHALLSVDPHANYQRTLDILSRTVELPEDNAYDGIIREMAVEFLAETQANPPQPKVERHPGRLGQP